MDEFPFFNPLEHTSAPSKSAKVDGGDWDRGSLGDPVPVDAGDEIEYTISLYAQCTAMMHSKFPLVYTAFSSDEITYGFYVDGIGVGPGQTYVAPVYDYDKVTVVNLPENITSEADFRRIVGNTWNGRPINAYWDVTETDPKYNPKYADSSKVYVWVTDSDRAPGPNANGKSTTFFDMYVGGGGGVILSPASPVLYSPTDTFKRGIFCANFVCATEFNLGWLDTSRGADFEHLFAGSLFSSRIERTIDMSGFDFSNISSYKEMFGIPGLEINAKTKLIIGSEEARDWLQDKFGKTGAFADYNPATGYGILVVPTDNPSQAIVTDTIPDGLSIVASSITSGDGITYTLGDDGRTITWTVPADKLPVDLTVTATVDAGKTDITDYINTATVSRGSYIVNTETTYHRYMPGYKVTESYFIYDGGPTTTKLDVDKTTMVAEGGSYSVLGSVTALGGYGYYGYSTDGGLTVVAGPPDAPVFSNINGSKEVRLYYQRVSGGAVSVTVHYVNESGTVIKNEVMETVARGSNYYMPMRHMNSFDVGPVTWVYYDHEYTNTVGSGKPVAASPNYPVFSDEKGPLPTFTGAEMLENKDVTLYFTAQKAVTVNFVEAGNPSNVLLNAESYFVPSSFDPGAAVRRDGAALTAGIDLTGGIGKLYTYAGFYSVNGGLVQNGVPGTQTAPCEMTLYFETTWTVDEMFVAYSYNEATGNYTVTAFDKEARRHTGLPGGYVYYALDDRNATLPDISGYKYIGYHFGRIETPMIPGEPAAPVINGVYADYTIIYVYEPDTTTNPGGGNPGGGNPGSPPPTVVTPPPDTSTQTDEPPAEPPVIPSPEPSPGQSPEPPSGPSDPEAGPSPSPDTSYSPGGDDPYIPPNPQIPGHGLIPDGDGFLELGDDGVPLGRWSWDDDDNIWIYEEFPPRANMPATGIYDVTQIVPGLLVSAILCVGLTLLLVKRREE